MITIVIVITLSTPEAAIYLNAQTLCRPNALWQSPLIAAAQRRLERRLGKRKVGFKLLAVAWSSDVGMLLMSMGPIGSLVSLYG